MNLQSPAMLAVAAALVIAGVVIEGAQQNPWNLAMSYLLPATADRVGLGDVYGGCRLRYLWCGLDAGPRWCRSETNMVKASGVLNKRLRLAAAAAVILVQRVTSRSYGQRLTPQVGLR